MPVNRRSSAVLRIAIVLAVLGCGMIVPAGIASAAAPPFPDPVFANPVTTTECVASIQRRCYTPEQLERAYDVESLYDRGITGQGRTVVVLTSFGSPTIQHDLDVFSRRWDLPSTDVRVLQWGAVPPFDATDPVRLDWAHEATQDVEATHLMAPAAKIVLVETAVAETQGTTGIPELMSALASLVDRGEVDVVSMSWATPESTFPGVAQGDYTSLLSLRGAFTDAVRHGVTLVASSGDGGGHASVLDAAWPAGDPLVTAVGGTELQLDDVGNRTSADSAWQRSGGEHSRVFARPGYQDSVRSVVGSQRGTPDVSMSASDDGALWIYSSFDPTRTGWTADGIGTSVSAPLFAGVVALAVQAAGHRLGLINQDLYRLDGRTGTGLVDITTGSTGSDGFTATPGYDQASGIGTVDVAQLIHTLACGR